MLRALSRAAAIVAIALAAAPAYADEVDGLRASARQLSRDGKWEEARAELERALAIRDDPVTAYLLAVAESATGRYAAALRRFRAFLAGPPGDALERYGPAARDAVVELEEQVGRVTVTTEPTVRDAAVMLDGRAVEPGAEEVVDPGVHVVVVRAAGYEHARREVTLAPGQAGEVRVPLTALGPAGEEAAPERDAPIAAAILLGSGALVFGVGLSIGLTGLREADEAPASEGPEADAALQKTIAGDVVAGVGIATAGVGLILLIVHYASDEEADAVAFSLGGLTLRF
jgi:hypothetical protein